MCGAAEVFLKYISVGRLTYSYTCELVVILGSYWRATYISAGIIMNMDL